MLEIIAGAVIAALFALIAYFLNRLISQNDRFQDETRRTHKVFGRAITRHQSALEEVEREVKAGAIDQETKRKISSLATSLMEVQEELRLIRPTLVKSEENYGQIIMLGEHLKAQEAKLKGLHDTIKILIQSKKGQQ